MLQPISIGAAVFIGQKGIESLFTAPTPSSGWLSLAPIRKELSELKEWGKKQIGDRNWSFCSNVCWNNAWISSIALAILLSGEINPKLSTFELYGNGVVLFICVSTLAWLTRFVMSKVFRQLSDFITPLPA